MKFDITKFNDLYHKISLWIFALDLMIYLASYNSLDESQAYNLLDPTQPTQFMIDRMENVGERKTFPLLLLSGKILDAQQRYECRISRGQYEKLAVGDTILVYETRDRSKIVTSYAIYNLKPFLSVFSTHLSIYVLGEGIMFLAMLTLFVFTSRLIYKTYMSKLPD